MSKGLLIVFTGNGKGKTTAALGMALRAAGHGLKVLILQFIKGAWSYGELETLKRFRGDHDRTVGIRFHLEERDTRGRRPARPIGLGAGCNCNNRVLLRYDHPR